MNAAGSAASAFEMVPQVDRTRRRARSRGFILRSDERTVINSSFDYSRKILIFRCSAYSSDYPRKSSTKKEKAGWTGTLLVVSTSSFGMCRNTKPSCKNRTHNDDRACLTPLMSSK